MRQGCEEMKNWAVEPAPAKASGRLGVRGSHGEKNGIAKGRKARSKTVIPKDDDDGDHFRLIIVYSGANVYICVRV